MLVLFSWEFPGTTCGRSTAILERQLKGLKESEPASNVHVCWAFLDWLVRHTEFVVSIVEKVLVVSTTGEMTCWIDSRRLTLQSSNAIFMHRGKFTLSLCIE